MANKIQFLSNTKKDVSGSYISGTDDIYYFQFSNGSNRNLREELKDYAYAKLTGKEVNTKKPSTISEYYWGLYKRPVSTDTNLPMTDEEFVNAINEYKLAPLGNSFIIPTGRDIVKTDRNGNILVASLTSKLNNEYDGCGDILIDGKTGKTLRKSKGNMIINPCNKRNGHYLVEIYQFETDKDTNAKYTTGVEYNFLNPNGKLVFPAQNFSKLSFNESRLYSFDRNFYSRNGKKVISDWDIYPNAYVYCTQREPEFFDNEVELIKSNRVRRELGLEPILDDETPYLVAMYKRKEILDEKVESFGKAYDKGLLNDATYKEILAIVSKEYTDYEYFESAIETDKDKYIASHMEEFEDILNPTKHLLNKTIDREIVE